MLLSIEQFQELLKEDHVLVLDTRTLDDLKLGYVPNAIHAPKHQIGKLIAMDFIKLESPIILIAPNGAEQEVLTIFEQLGFSNIKGILQGGFESWIQSEKKFDILIDVDVDELAMDIPFDEYLMILDVRTEDQYQENHIKNAISLPLVELADPGSMSELDEHFNIYIISDNGEDASIASTILKKQGIHNNRIVNDGWEAVQFLKDKFKFDKVKPPKKEDSSFEN